MKEDNNQLTAYLHSQDGKYLGAHILDSSHQDPLGNHNIPHGAVAVEPPVPREDFDIYWTGIEWEYRAVPQEPEPELPTLEETKEQKLLQISAWKNQAIFGGFESDAKGTAMAYDSEVDAQLNLHTLYVVSNSPDFATNPAYNGVVQVPAALVSEPANGKSNVAHSATEVENVIVDLAVHRDACNDREAALQEQVRLAETIEQLDEIKWKEPEPVPPVPVAYKTMGVLVDEEATAETGCTYVGDAVGMTVGSDEWDTWFGYKPCAFKAGQVLGYLDPNNFKKFADGTDAPVTGDTGADVMIEFPRMGVKFERDENNPRKYIVWLTNNPADPDFTYYAHNRGGFEKSAFYYGGYKGIRVNKKLRSQPDPSPAAQLWLRNEANEPLITTSRMISAAKLLGDGYCISSFYQLTFIQCLFLLKHCTFNSQQVMGPGLVARYFNSSVNPTTFDKGLNHVSTGHEDKVKLFGIEDVYGNYPERLNGVTQGNGTWKIPEDPGTIGGFLTVPSSYQNVTGNGVGYFSKVIGTSQLGFLPNENISSATGIYKDYIGFSVTTMIMRGGLQESAGYVGLGTAGLFALGHQSETNMSFKDPNTGLPKYGVFPARLMYL